MAARHTAKCGAKAPSTVKPEVDEESWWADTAGQWWADTDWGSWQWVSDDTHSDTWGATQPQTSAQAPAAGPPTQLPPQPTPQPPAAVGGPSPAGPPEPPADQLLAEPSPSQGAAEPPAAVQPMTTAGSPAPATPKAQPPLAAEGLVGSPAAATPKASPPPAAEGLVGSPAAATPTAQPLPAAEGLVGPPAGPAEHTSAVTSPATPPSAGSGQWGSWRWDWSAHKWDSWPDAQPITPHVAQTPGSGSSHWAASPADGPRHMPLTPPASFSQGLSSDTAASGAGGLPDDDGCPLWYKALSCPAKEHVRATLHAISVKAKPQLDITWLCKEYNVNADDIFDLETYLGFKPAVLPGPLLGPKDGDVKMGVPSALVRSNIGKATAMVNAACGYQADRATGSGTGSTQASDDGKSPESEESHRAKYMRFLRACRNPKRSKIGTLSLSKFNGGEQERLDLFEAWKSCGEDMEEVELSERRIIEEFNTQNTKLCWKNKFDLMKKYMNDEDVVNTIINGCKAAGKMRPCPEHPDIAKLTEYHVRWEEASTEETRQGKRHELTTSGEVDAADAAHLLTGRFSMKRPLAATTPAPETPKGKTGRRGGGEGKKDKDKDKDKDKETKDKDKPKAKAELMAPSSRSSADELVSDAMEQTSLIGREISRGMALIMKCKALACGSDTVGQIEKLCSHLQEVYNSLQSLLQADSTDAREYTRLIEAAMPTFKTLKKQCKIAQAVSNAAGGSKPKKKAKKDDSDDGEEL